MDFFILELLKNSIAVINKITSTDHFMKQKQDGEFIF